MRPRRPPRAGQAGFTLVEMAVALVLLLLALALAADLLQEAAQLFAYTSGEALDTPVPLAIARIRNDVQGSTGVVPVPGRDGLDGLVIQGLDRPILYEKRGDALYRRVVPGEPSPLWRGVTSWRCQVLASGLVDLEVTYRRRAVPHSPLPGLPAESGPALETATQKMYLLPRGGGLAETW
jgi:prepilin-type N-terminal cleavage/methylation domain-containing protein